MNPKQWIVLLLLSWTTLASAQPKWSTDYTTALNRARNEGKLLLINFTGSDWCQYCIQLKKEVFETPEFAAFASERLVLLEVDFPRNKSVPREQNEKNVALKRDFGISGYPNVQLVGSDGKRFGRIMHGTGGPGRFIDQINAKLGIPSQPQDAKAAANPVPKAPSNVASQPPAFAVVAPVIKYDNIALKGIMGSRTKLALINNQSLGAGEKGKIKVGDKNVEILVKEIRESSVLVQVEGENEPRELKLKADVK